MCFDYDGYYDFSTSAIRKARKQRRCDGCSRRIEPGELYESTAGKFDGEFVTSSTCRRCLYDVARVVAHELDEGCDWYESWPAVSELRDYLIESDMGQTPFEAVPANFDPKVDWSEKLIARLRKPQLAEAQP